MSQKDLLSNARRVSKGTGCYAKNNISGGTRKSLKLLRVMFLTAISPFAPTKGQTLALSFKLPTVANYQRLNWWTQFLRLIQFPFVNSQNSRNDCANAHSISVPRAEKSRYAALGPHLEIPCSSIFVFRFQVFRLHMRLNNCACVEWWRSTCTTMTSSSAKRLHNALNYPLEKLGKSENPWRKLNMRL